MLEFKFIFQFITNEPIPPDSPYELVNHVTDGIGDDSDGNKLVDAFAQVDLDDIIKLVKIYHYDMVYFGYEFDKATYFISGFE